jgi:hypothetical protein
MTLFDRPLAELSANDLLALIGESEGKNLDFKRELVGTSDGDRKEFLYDISSFANTQGGDLVFGIAETGGVASAVTGFTGLNADGEILRLQQMARDGIRPPINGLDARAVKLADGSLALVLRIPRSWNPPHQVTFQKTFRFYARDTNGKYQVDVDELRSAFTASSTIADRLRAFRAERLARIVSGDPPAPLQDGAKVVLHVVPFSAFGAGSIFPLQVAAHQPTLFPTWKDRTAQHVSITFDGLLATSNRDAPPTAQRAYTLVSRTGTVEAVSTVHDRSPLPQLQALMVKHALLYTQSLVSLGVTPPIAVFVSLVRARGVQLIHDFVPHGAMLEDLPSGRLADDQFAFVETILESVPKDGRDAAGSLRITLDHLANAAGLPTSPHFDDQGIYLLKVD